MGGRIGKSKKNLFLDTYQHTRSLVCSCTSHKHNHLRCIHFFAIFSVVCIFLSFPSSFDFRGENTVSTRFVNTNVNNLIYKSNDIRLYITLPATLLLNRFILHLLCGRYFCVYFFFFCFDCFFLCYVAIFRFVLWWQKLLLFIKHKNDSFSYHSFRIKHFLRSQTTFPVIPCLIRVNFKVVVFYLALPIYCKFSSFFYESTLRASKYL